VEEIKHLGKKDISRNGQRSAPARRRNQRDGELGGGGCGAGQEQCLAEGQPCPECAVCQGLREGGRDALHGIAIKGSERGDVLECGVEAAGGGGGHGGAVEEMDEAKAVLVGAELPQKPWRWGQRGWREICIVCCISRSLNS